MKDIRLGNWQDVLADVTCDALICDPPYSERCHHGANTNRNDGYSAIGLARDYDHFDSDDIDEFFESWSPRCRGWIVALCDSSLIDAYRSTAEKFDRLAFAPVPCVIRGMTVRMSGDGPSSWTVYAMVSRPRSAACAKWGTLPGAYVGNQSQESLGGRGKPDWLMRGLVRDYSRKGDLVVDPFAGWGATLSAALGLGRQAIGAERDEIAFSEAQRRLDRGQQADLFASEHESVFV